MGKPKKTFRAMVTVTQVYEVELPAASHAEATDLLRNLSGNEFPGLFLEGDEIPVSFDPGCETEGIATLKGTPSLDFSFVREVHAGQAQAACPSCGGTGVSAEDGDRCPQCAGKARGVAS